MVTAGPLSAPARLLVLVRHAKAAAATGGGGGAGFGRGADVHRPLTDQGRAQAQVTAERLHDAGLSSVDRVLVSSALRAQQTWEVLSAGITARTVRREEALYEGSAQGLANLLAQTPDGVRALMVVGHEPVLSEVAAALAGEGSDGAALARVRAGVSTGSACVLALDGTWSGLGPGSCRLVAYIGP